MHDPNKVLLGRTLSSAKEVSCHDSDPSTFEAGLAVRQGVDGLSLEKDDGLQIGISLGKSLSNHKQTSVCRSGTEVPIQLTDDSVAAELEVGDLTFKAKEKGEDGNDITIALVAGATAGSEVVTVEGTDIVIQIANETSTAQQIKDAVEASFSASDLVSVEIASGQEAEPQTVAAEDALEGGENMGAYVVIGQKVYIDDVTGKARASGAGATISDAIYSSGIKSGVKENKTEVPVAIVDMPGGL